MPQKLRDECSARILSVSPFFCTCFSGQRVDTAQIRDRIACGSASLRSLSPSRSPARGYLERLLIVMEIGEVYTQGHPLLWGYGRLVIYRALHAALSPRYSAAQTTILSPVCVSACACVRVCYLILRELWSNIAVSFGLWENSLTAWMGNWSRVGDVDPSGRECGGCGRLGAETPAAPTPTPPAPTGRDTVRGGTPPPCPVKKLRTPRPPPESRAPRDERDESPARRRRTSLMDLLSPASSAWTVWR